MRLDDKVREDVWERYCDLERQLIDLKNIVQNPFDLTEQDLNHHKDRTAKIIKELADIHHCIFKELK